MNMGKPSQKFFLCLMCLVSLLFAGCNNLGAIFGDEGRDEPETVSIDTNIVTAPPAFMANRPFFFAIRDNETKTVLFMGTVVDP